MIDHTKKYFARQKIVIRATFGPSETELSFISIEHFFSPADQPFFRARIEEKKRESVTSRLLEINGGLEAAKFQIRVYRQVYHGLKSFLKKHLSFVYLSIHLFNFFNTVATAWIKLKKHDQNYNHMKACM